MRRKTTPTRDQRAVLAVALNFKLRGKDGVIRGTKKRIKTAIARAITPPNLFGIERRIA